MSTVKYRKSDGTFESINISPASKSSFIISFNGGAAENKDLYTFNGSALKSINIVAGNNIVFSAENNKVTIDTVPLGDQVTYILDDKTLIITPV